MTASTQRTVPLASLLQRSENWLKGNPGLGKVKSALTSIVNKVRKGDITNDTDAHKTADALIEFYVDRGGDLTDLPSLDDTPPAPLRSVERVPQPEHMDCGSLYPDAPVGKPLSREEKQDVIAGLKAVLRRPEGM